MWKRVLKYVILMVIFGGVYCVIEMAYRQRTHWTMFIVGGLCGVICGLLNEVLSWETPLCIQAFIGALSITIIEFASGCIVNLWLHWNVWDYSNVPLNILGQICVPFIIVWYGIAHIAIILDDYLRFFIFNEEKPHYKMWFDKK